ncbi:MAG: peptide chain release factor N(5)-glutamine methyltransferase [Clostridia bacterium]|nr:peptide chain release factor N(5)-glutamine methyltransferase [Clostridia bacterium]
MTYKALSSELEKLGVAEPDTEAILLLSHLFGISRADTLIYPDRDYDSPALSEAICRRSSGEPIQYIIGSVLFCGCEIKVTPDCLIPRSETELLCELLTDILPKNAHILELCTGSGCIPIALLSHRKDITCEAVELYEKTAALARYNRDANGIGYDRLDILCADALALDADVRACKYDAVVSNPPYIKSEVIPTLSREVLREPHAALDGGDDGMLFYNKFLSDYAKMLKADGFFAFEIGFDQGDEIKKLCEKLGYSCEIRRDFSGCDRIAVIRP